MEAFAERVFGDIASTTLTMMSCLGDRLGLFKDLAAQGASTSAELAARTSLDERYAREWLGAMAAAGYLDHAPADDRYSLPSEHAPVLAQEDGPLFMGGSLQQLLSWMRLMDAYTRVFREGGGVSQSAYSQDMWDGMERESAAWVKNSLVQEWVPKLPEVEAALHRGCAVADLGCGRGGAIIQLAQAYPNSRFVGYDVFEPTIVAASEKAAASGVADRVRFTSLDAVGGLPEQYDIITSFDVVHDAADPSGLLRTIHQALQPGGHYICVEPNCEDPNGPVATLWYTCSLMYCMTTSLAQGGAALGAMGLPEAKLRMLCVEAGFSDLQRVPVEDPFLSLYHVLP